MVKSLMKVQAILPTAGSGARFKSKLAKPFVNLDGSPVIVHTLRAFEKSRLIDSVIIVAAKEYVSRLRKLVRDNAIKKVGRIVEGGKTRCESVSNGLKHLDADTSIVVVHDGVRPLIESDLIDAAIKAAVKSKAVVVAVPVKSTIKRVDHRSMNVIETLNRAELWDIQTPQVFERAILEEAHRKNKNMGATDDAILVEKLGQKVKIIEGNPYNIKITTREDLLMAQAVLRRARRNEKWQIASV